jgi:23S rRNA (uracil1939-C5)-methyltransferase
MSNPSTETAEIVDIGDGLMLGQCPSGEKIWIAGPCVPGDTVTFIRHGKRGVLQSVDQPAPERRDAPCPHFETCPGCTLQPLSYARQCEFKAEKIVQTLRRIGGFKDFDWRGLRGSPEEFGTRNKLDVTVDGARIGYTNGYELLTIEDCLLGNDLIREILAKLKPLFHLPHGLHRLTIRTQTDRNHAFVLVRGTPMPDGFMETCQADPRIAGVFQQPQKTDPYHCIHGVPALTMHLAGIEHRLRADAFFQVHDQQAESLVQTAMAWLAESPCENLLDLFCGAGAFTLPAKRHANAVLGIDTTPGGGPDFIRADLSKGLPEDSRLRSRKWDTVLVDPPRDGMEKRLCKQIRDHLKPERILYISCNPATLARDLSRFANEGAYALERVEGFDLFPQTTHVETLALMRRKI